MVKDKIGVLFLLVSVFVVLIICDLATPWLYRHIETDHYRTILLLNKIRDPKFNPDLLILGSSKSMSGIDATIMSNKLGIDCYNFSSPNQSPEEGSLFFSELPSSLKTLIMVIFPPVKDIGSSDEKSILPSNVSTAFVFGNYKLGEDIKELNNLCDMSSLVKNRLLLNLDARGSIVIPGLYNYLRRKSEAGTKDFKYPYSYTEERLANYEQSVEEFKKRSHVGKEIVWDKNVINTLNNYSTYLKSKGIHFLIAILPTNPDVEEFTKEQMEWINSGLSSQFPNTETLNYLSCETNDAMYFDAIHFNRAGGKCVTDLLIDDLKHIISK